MHKFLRLDESLGMCVGEQLAEIAPRVKAAPGFLLEIGLAGRKSGPDASGGAESCPGGGDGGG
jgi:hypothetical protein